MPKLAEPKPREDGWTDWIAPLMTRYRIGCCDCGLVHDFKFRVVKVTKRYKDGSWEHGKPLGKSYRVQFKATRNERSTAGCRRKGTKNEFVPRKKK